MRQEARARSGRRSPALHASIFSLWRLYGKSMRGALVDCVTVVRLSACGARPLSPALTGAECTVRFASLTGPVGLQTAIASPGYPPRARPVARVVCADCMPHPCLCPLRPAVLFGNGGLRGS